MNLDVSGSDLLLYIFTTLVQTLLVMRYYSYLCEIRFKCKAIYVLSGFIYTTCLVAVHFIFDNSFVNFFAHIALLLLLSLFYKDFKQNFFMTLNLEYVLILSDAIVFYTIGIIFYNFPEAVREETYDAIGLVLSKIVMLILSFYYAKKLKGISNESKSIPFSYWISIYVVPFCSCFILYYIHMIVTVAGAISPLTSIAVMVLFVINISNTLLINHLVASYNIKLKEREMLEQLTYFQHQSEIDIVKVKTVSQMHHDINNILIAIKGASEENNNELVCLKIDKYLNELNKVSNATYLGNSIIDSMINTKVDKAKKYNITIKVNVVIKETIKIDWVDVAIVVGSALDNAIEACRSFDSQEPINLLFIIEHNLLTIIISNKYKGYLKFDDKKQLVSNKQNSKAQHGFGLKCIEQIVQKHHGKLYIKTDNNIFTLKVIIDAIK